EYHVGKTLVRPKTNEPRWNEEFVADDVHSGRAIGFTVFHNCVMPPDDFVANTRIPFDDLKIGSTNDIWVDLEPHGQLHVVIELHGSSVEGKPPSLFLFFSSFNCRLFKKTLRFLGRMLRNYGRGSARVESMRFVT
ncbi:hypothetical protein COOONC_05689, partial [Cooperia oncophora]